MANNQKNTSFEQILEELLDDSKIFPAVYLNRFSDLDPENLAALRRIWSQIDPVRRVRLMEDLEVISEADTLTCFDDLCFMALSDEEPGVRATAIRMLWETNNASFSDRLLQILSNDPDETVRSTAASGLGMYIYLGEVAEISDEKLRRVESALLKVMAGDEKRIVKRKSLESLGFSSRPEVSALIRKAFETDDIEWRASAIFAMGRSADKTWKDTVIRSLHDPDHEIRYEAVRAAGELELKSARQTIMEMLAEPENREDEDIRKAIVWSLSQIGGESVREVLATLLEQAEDEEEEEFIATAVENLGLTEGMNVFGLLDIELDDDRDDDDEDDDDDGLSSGSALDDEEDDMAYDPYDDEEDRYQ